MKSIIFLDISCIHIRGVHEYKVNSESVTMLDKFWVNLNELKNHQVPKLESINLFVQLI